MTAAVHTKIKMVPLSKILPYAQNAKLHPPEQVKALAASIKAHGWDQPIVVDRDFVVIKGHGRRLAALELGMKEAPVLVREDLTPDQVRAARLADNRVAMGDYDTEVMQGELAALADAGYDLGSMGFGEKEIEMLTKAPDAMNLDAAMEDLDTSVADQAARNEETIERVNKDEVAIAKALGFKSIPGEHERNVNHFMAIIEARSGAKGAAAFLAFVNSVLKTEAGA